MIGTVNAGLRSKALIVNNFVKILDRGGKMEGLI